MNYNIPNSVTSIRQQQQQRSLMVINLLSSIAGICGLALLAGIGWGYVFQPVLADFQRIHQENLEVLALREKESDTREQLRQAQAQAQLWRLADADRLERSSPDQDDAAFLKWLNQQATSCGLTVRDFRPLGREQLDGYLSRGITIAAFGSYESICMFLDQLRLCPRMNRITSLEITPRDDSGSEFQINLQGQLFTHVKAVSIALSHGK